MINNVKRFLQQQSIAAIFKSAIACFQEQKKNKYIFSLKIEFHS